MEQRDLRERGLLFILGVTGFGGVVGGLFLALDPTGSALSARVSDLSATPFSDWRIPGVFLAVLVGLGGLAVFAGVLERAPLRRAMAMAYGTGLFGFELAEWIWIGPHALEIVFAAVGITAAVLAGTSATLRVGPRGRDERPDRSTRRGSTARARSEGFEPPTF